MTDGISPELIAVLRRLKLSLLLPTLADRLALARQQQLSPQELLLTVLADEVSRRDSAALALRTAKAQLDPALRLERWDDTSPVTFDRGLLRDLATLRFLDQHHHVAIIGPVGVGKTFLAHALGHLACARGASVLLIRTDRMLKRLKHARLDHTVEAEMRRLLAVELLVLDDFGLDAMDPTESRDVYELFLERHRAGSIIVTSNRDPAEWLGTFADPMRAQSAIDRFTSNAYDLVLDGPSYRDRLKPRRPAAPPEEGSPRKKK